MKKLPIINQTTFTSISKVFHGSSRIISSEPKNISPHIKVAASVIIDDVAKKSEYLPDIHILMKDFGLSVKQISEKLPISQSYIYKLIKK